MAYDRLCKFVLQLVDITAEASAFQYVLSTFKKLMERQIKNINAVEYET